MSHKGDNMHDKVHFMTHYDEFKAYFHHKKAPM